MIPNSCPSCGGTAWSFVHCLRNTYTLEKCRGCGLLRSVGTPPHGTGEDEFGELDLDSYFHSMESLRKSSAAHLLDVIQSYCERGTVLDVGCSFGWLLDVARDKGWETYGIEPSDLAFNYVVKKDLHHIKHGLFPETRFGDQQFNAIVMTDVMEHLPDPVRTIKELSQALLPGGVIALRVPNREGLIYQVAALLAKVPVQAANGPLWRMWQLDFPYPHLWYFDPDTLSSTAKAAGGKILHVETEPAIRLGAVSTRVQYLSGPKGGASLLRRMATTAGLGICAAGAQLLGMHDECMVVFQPAAENPAA